MSIIPIDIKQLEAIALLLSSTEGLPHSKYQNRANRYCYLVPINNPTSLIVSLAFATNNADLPLNRTDVTEVPVTGDTYAIDGEQVLVYSFIAYSRFRSSSCIISSHCEKITAPVHYRAALSDNRVYSLKAGSVVKGLVVPDNIVDLSRYR